MKKQKFLISGPNKIHGDVKISGSKNSALPILFSCLLTKKDIKLKNIPKLKDINVTIKLFKKIGVKIKKTKNSIIINSENINEINFTNKLIKKIRASIWLLSPILIRLKKIKLSTPGGCKLGKRPIDLHIYSLKRLGVNIKYNNNIIIAKIKNRLKSNLIKFNKISVGATITSIMASVLIPGITTIKNCAKEPEITDMINFLNKIGAKIKSIGTNTIIIKGVKKLNSGVYKIIPDRIETGTYLIAGIICKSKITCYNTNPKLLKYVLNKLQKSGAELNIKNDFITLKMNKRPKAINIITNPYPLFPTDLQPQYTLINCIANGKSIIEENIFKQRFSHVNELNKMGSKLKIIKNKIICHGVKKISSNIIKANDLRSSITLLLAACIANGTTIIKKIDYVYRGYENVIEKFKNIGINIKIIN